MGSKTLKNNSIDTKRRKLEFKKEIQIPVPWGHFSAKIWGSEDGIPVIALHGLMDNAGSFDALAPLLPPQIFLVCLESCGHGHSSTYPPGVILHYFDHAYHLKLVLDYFKWEKVILLGHSIGAITAFTFASLFPDMVSKLISLDIVKPFSVSIEKLPARMQSILNQMDILSKGAENGPLPSVTYQEARQTLIENYKGSVDEKSADILLVRGLKRRNNEEAYELAFDMRNLVHTLTLSEDQIKVIIRRISSPLLIIRAKSGLVNFSEMMFQEYLDIYKSNSQDFRYIEVDGTHHVHLTHPERIASQISDFILSTNLHSKL